MSKFLGGEAGATMALEPQGITGWLFGPGELAPGASAWL